MKKKRKLGALYFTGLDIVDDDIVVLTGHYYALENTDDERTAFLSFNKGVWGSLNVSGISHAIRFKPGSKTIKRECLLLERNRGLYRIATATDVKFERIAEKRDGFLMDLRQIAGHWYAVGGHHQVHVEQNGHWTPFDNGIYVPGEAGEAKILLGIDGLSQDDIYAVGLNGVIFHYDGVSWKLMDSPTNLGLQRVLCINKDEVYLCGNGNGLYRGSKNTWVPLTDPDKSVTFWDMESFQGEVYACTKEALFKIKNDQLSKVDIPLDGPLAFYRMASNKSQLWACGNECLLRYDGKRWKQYAFIDNQ
ncbi:conserved hypothetical protein [Desulfosarcina cetonica]|uniref:hypothetical protein n=1 Tax=Desulfosarcina cetonica TaxID=90730 RepID=UPI0006D1A13B|nr:hypothetical protein [Desulfosarcina cetonica]VTR64628.1 conserved hypothetical protein [Desulfosarcina cetonica]